MLFLKSSGSECIRRGDNVWLILRTSLALAHAECEEEILCRDAVNSFYGRALLRVRECAAEYATRPECERWEALAFTVECEEVGQSLVMRREIILTRGGDTIRRESVTDVFDVSTGFMKKSSKCDKTKNYSLKE